jgi:hypothetical protein
MSPNKPIQLARLVKLLAGVQLHLTNASLQILGRTVTTADIVLVLQSLITLGNAVTSRKADYSTAVQADRDGLATNKQFVDTLKQVILTMFGNQANILADFGLSPRKPRKAPTAKVQVAAQNKGKATRQARHTMGTKQRKGVTGNVPVNPAASGSPAPNGNGNAPHA